MKRKVYVLITITMLLGLFTGCTNNETLKESASENATENVGETKDNGTVEIPQEIPVFSTIMNVPEDGKIPDPKDSDSEVSKWFGEQIGVKYTVESPQWGGGKDYTQTLNIKLASGDLPDLVRVWGGFETTMIEAGKALALDDLLKEHAPNVLKRIPESAWNATRNFSDDGKIYFIPQAIDFPERATMIRQDWLDRVDKKMPTTLDEFVDVLKAFRDQDANGNGDPNDEYPTSGRELGRWMDELFLMYGVAMWEGYPDWDIYNGKLEYSAVQPEMKEALKFIRMLYEEKLLDNETFLNTNEAWQAKISNDQVGLYFHLPKTLFRHTYQNTIQVNPEAKLAGMPLPKIDGVNGYIPVKEFLAPYLVLNADMPEDHIIPVLQYLNFIFSEEYEEFAAFGLEGMHYELVDGKKQRLPLNANQEWIPVSGTLDYESFKTTTENQYSADPWKADMIIELIDTASADGKIVAGAGIPSSIYEGYEDIKSNKLYLEYMTKIIIGDWDIDKFDEFVEKWYAQGGEEVTKRANEWYSNSK